MSDSIVPGTVIAGKYRVERVLGAGGMGMVVLAHHLTLDEKVAIKLLLASPLQGAESVARFQREARAAVRIKSEYVVRVSDVGSLESGTPYMVMEYLEGEDLSQMLSRGPLPTEQAVEFTLQACEALAEAHALGIVHRDIKPANLFCVRRTDGLLAVKLLDFGISSAHGGADLALTKSGVVMGSPQYMAPEQMIAAKNADGRSDIWSLGAALFELLVGEPPFHGETFAELVMQVNMADSVKLAGRLGGVPPGLAEIVLRCLSIDVSLRYATVSDLARALVPFGPTGRAQVHADRILRIARTSQHPSMLPPEAALEESAEWEVRAGKTLAPLGRTSPAGRANQGLGRAARLALGVLGLLAIGLGWWSFNAHPESEVSRLPGRDGLIPPSVEVASRPAPEPAPEPAPSVDRASPEPRSTDPRAKTRREGTKAKLARPVGLAPAKPGEPVLPPAAPGPEVPKAKSGEEPDFGGRL